MNTLEEWTAAVCEDLGLEPGSAYTRTVLDLTRDVARGVARPAAPLTAYLVGVAVGRGSTLPDAAERISALAAGWPQQSQDPAAGSAGSAAGSAGSAAGSAGSAGGSEQA